VLAASVLISFMVFESHFIKPAEYFHELPIYLVPIVLVGGILAFLAGWIPIVRKEVEILAENAVIFLYISVPLSLLALVVVIVRNLLIG
jgi:cation transport ATPase